MGRRGCAQLPGPGAGDSRLRAAAESLRPCVRGRLHLPFPPEQPARQSAPLMGGRQRQVLDQPVPASLPGLCLSEPRALGRPGLLAGFCLHVRGSLLWEEAGENTAPSFNDQVASGIGGNFLGEPLFRIASLLLESGSGSPRVLARAGCRGHLPRDGIQPPGLWQAFRTGVPQL